MPRTRRIASGLALLLVLGAACTSDPPPAAHDPLTTLEPQAMVLAAVDKAGDAGSIHMTFAIHGSADGYEIAGSGEADVVMDPLQEHMTFHFSPTYGMPPSGLDLEVILAGHSAYMASPQLAGLPGLDTKWIGIDLRDVVPHFRQLAEVATGRNDPTQGLEYLRGATHVKDLGTETLDGRPTTHYSGIADLQQAARDVPPELKDDFEAVLAQFRKQFGRVTMPFDVWIDGDGLVRKMVFGMQTSGKGEVGPVSLQVSVEVDSYDSGVQIHEPAPRTVTDVEQLERAIAAQTPQ